MPGRRVKRLAKRAMPEKQRAKLRSLKERASGYGFRTYSQQGEDIILRTLFHGVESGFYVDVGAHHPKRYSNTYHFYRRGWRGINIDAMPGGMKRFDRLRPRDVNLEIGVSRDGELLRYYGFDEPGINGFYAEDPGERFAADGRHVLFTRDIETFPLREVLDTHLPGGQEISFMSVDVEGLDVEVLASNDWSKYAPGVVLAEALGSNALEEALASPVYELLVGEGYFLYSKCVHTLIFAKQGFLNS